MKFFSFQSVDDAGNAAPYIEAYCNKSKVFIKIINAELDISMQQNVGTNLSVRTQDILGPGRS